MDSTMSKVSRLPVSGQTIFEVKHLQKKKYLTNSNNVFSNWRIRLESHPSKPNPRILGLTNVRCESTNSQSHGRIESSTMIQNSDYSLKDALQKLDKFLASGDDKAALEFARELKGKQLRAFGSAQQIPKRIYSLEELRLNKIETDKFLSPKDSTLGGVKRTLQIAVLIGGLAAWQGLGWDQMQLLGFVIFALFLGTADQIVNGGGGEALILDTMGNLLSSQYRDRVALHEAGHFLISYLVGILPRSYTLNSLDALRKYGAVNVQAGTTFVDYEFQEETQSGKLSSKTLDNVTCVALAGVATEYLFFQVAEGGLSDVLQLDSILKSLGFTQKKADSQIRWAVLNTVILLRRHVKVHKKLANAMKDSRSVGECIELIEDELRNEENI